MYTVYGDLVSGNCYKVKLLMSLLDIPCDWQHVDVLSGATHTDDFKRMSLAEKIPVLKISDEHYLSESNAILHYLAEGSTFLPDDRLLRAQVLQWQFFEQYSHEPCIAVARFIQKYLGLPESRRAEYESKHEGGYAALNVMENQLRRSSFLVGDQCTLADISLYAYTHVADEGGFDLAPYEAINAWFRRIETLSRYEAMPKQV